MAIEIYNNNFCYYINTCFI